MYEINTPNEFEEFHHENYRPLRSRTWFIKQEIVTDIVEKINSFIQDSLQLHQRSKGPIHLVSSESAAGSLKVGLPKPHTVIAIPDNLTFGPLGKLDKKTEQKIREEWLFNHINDEQQEGDYASKFSNMLRQIDDIVDSIPIYLWCGNNVAEQIGIRFMVYLLREKKNAIYLITEDKTAISYTAHLHSEQIKKIFEQNKDVFPLSSNERSTYIEEWFKLVDSKEVLRIWNGREIIGVSKNYYDFLIQATAETLHNSQSEKEFLPVGEIIAEILNKEIIDPFFLEYRIRHLTYDGTFHIKGIPKSMHSYKIKLK
ncbi:DUF1835 domain-containing protein [Psychrobacillus sp. FSL W7-1493]|uniref:DUF1835 domain-containing protein n=1 Tax=Psychrobacillus sp. FSL W7-1493 TaxID=2921552 RepID=UPI0030F4D1B3